MARPPNGHDDQSWFLLDRPTTHSQAFVTQRLSARQSILLLNGISPGTRSDRRQRRLAQSSSGRAKQLAKSAKENAEKSPLPSRGKWNLLSIVWIAVVLDRKKWESAFAKSMVKLIPRFVKHYAKKRDIFWSDRPSPSPPRPGASGDHPTPVGVRLDCQVKRQRPPNVGKHFAGNTLQTAVCSNIRWPGDAVVHGFDTLSGYHPTAAPSPRSKGLQSSVIATAGRRLHHRLVWQAPAESSTPCFRKRNVRSRHP